MMAASREYFENKRAAEDSPLVLYRVLYVVYT